MKAHVVSFLVCPHDRSSGLLLLSFEYENEQNTSITNAEVLEGILMCKKCKRWYPIKDGILIMLPDSMRTERSEQVSEDIAFLNKWREVIPVEILERGLPTNLQQSMLSSLLERSRSIVISQHEELSDNAASDYDMHEIMNPATRYVMRQEEKLVWEAVKNITDKRVALDLGCGTGRYAQKLAKEFELVIGVDISPEMVYEARRICRLKKLANVAFIIGDAEQLAFRPNTFDLVVASFGLLSFLFNYVMAINHICGVLRVGGILCATVYNKGFKEMNGLLRKVPWQSPLAISWSPTKPDTMIVKFGQEFEIHSKAFGPKELAGVLGRGSNSR